MIIARSPLRLSLGGGGTDVPSYSREHEGFLVAAAIDKYVYLTLHETFVSDLIVKYSRLERVPHARELEHPILREALALLGVDGGHLEITSMADIPSGTGLGSSGSFTTALLKVLHAWKRNLVLPGDLAEQASHVEIDRLKEPIGKQDTYIAAFGGLTCFTFAKDGTVRAEPLRVSEETLYNLEDNLLLFFTGYSRAASSILRDQDERSKQKDDAMLERLHGVKRSGYDCRAALEAGDLRGFGALMHRHWEEKRSRSPGMTNPEIDAAYDLAMANGALGGKLIGAGGGGFLLFYTEEKKRLRHALFQRGLREVRFRFDFEGTRILSA